MGIFQILSGTPIWVFFIFAYLITIGIQATKDRETHIGKLLIMPSVFLVLFVVRLIKISRSDIFIIFIIALITALIISHFFIKKESIKVEKFQVFLKGSYETLIIVMTIFFIKYYFGYMNATHGELEKYLIAEIIISGITTGFFVNKIARYLRLLYRPLDK